MTVKLRTTVPVSCTVEDDYVIICGDPDCAKKK